MPPNLLRAVLVTAVVAAGVAAATLAPYALVGAVLLAGGAAAALTADPLTRRRLPRGVQPLARLARRARGRTAPVARQAVAKAAPVARKAVAAGGARVRDLQHAGEQGLRAAVRQLGPPRVDLGQVEPPAAAAASVRPAVRVEGPSAAETAEAAQGVIGLSGEAAEHRRLAQLEQSKAAATDDPEVRARALAAAARHRARVAELEAELTGLRTVPPLCPDCRGYLGWNPAGCGTCRGVAGQSPAPHIDTRTSAPPDPAPPSVSTDQEIPMSTTSSISTTSSSSSDGGGLGTAGRASIQGLIVDWESSVEARQHPETFVAWLRAQAAAARQRAQMVPELVAAYHGRGPSGHAGVPEDQIRAFSGAYEESAMAEAAAYDAWALAYELYVEAAEEEMTRTYGREVIGAARDAHQGP